MIEITLTMSNGRSSFSNEVYVGNHALKKIVEELDTFKTHVHGGIYDLDLGGFGPEYASGAAHIRLHFYHMARLCVSGILESDFQEFGDKKIANKAELYAYSEPALLDNFIDGLRSISNNRSDEAILLPKQ